MQRSYDSNTNTYPSGIKTPNCCNAITQSCFNNPLRFLSLIKALSGDWILIWSSKNPNTVLAQCIDGGVQFENELANCDSSKSWASFSSHESEYEIWNIYIIRTTYDNNINVQTCTIVFRYWWLNHRKKSWYSKETHISKRKKLIVKKHTNNVECDILAAGVMWLDIGSEGRTQSEKITRKYYKI